MQDIHISLSSDSTDEQVLCPTWVKNQNCWMIFLLSVFITIVSLITIHHCTWYNGSMYGSLMCKYNTQLTVHNTQLTVPMVGVVTTSYRAHCFIIHIHKWSVQPSIQVCHAKSQMHDPANTLPTMAVQ